MNWGKLIERFVDGAVLVDATGWELSRRQSELLEGGWLVWISGHFTYIRDGRIYDSAHPQEPFPVGYQTGLADTLGR